MSQTIHVAICDHCSTTRYGLRHILNAEPDIEIVKEASSSKDLLSKFAEIDLDVILVDLESYPLRILIALRSIIHSDDRAVYIRVVFKNGGGEVRSECSNTAFSREV